MSQEDNRSISAQKTIGNFIWRFLERCGVQGVTLLVSIVLARLLDPETHGTIALVTVFTSILQVFVNSGMGTALIQKKNADSLDFSSLFYFNVVMGLALYGIMFVAAPFIAAFYKMPDLTPVIRVLSLILVVAGVRNIQNAYVSRHMIFKKFFFSTIGGALFSAVVGIVMAYMGFGVWALVAQMLTNQVMATAILWLTVPWRPTREFSLARLKGLFSYGWKMLISSLLDTVYNDLRSLIIGKRYSSTDLAFFNKGKQFPNILIVNINASIDSVLLPAMSREQDDKGRVRDMTRRAIKTSSFIIMPLMMGLAICAEPLVSLLLTDKWLPCVPYMRIFCITYAFYPLNTANLNAIKAMGRSDLFLKLEIIKKSVGVLAILITMHFGVIWMAYSLIFTSLVSQLVNTYPNRKLLDYSYGKQLKDIFPPLLLSAVMGAVVWCVSLLHLAPAWTLCIQIPLGVVFYTGAAWLLKMERFFYIKKQLENVLRRSSRKRKK